MEISLGLPKHVIFTSFLGKQGLFCELYLLVDGILTMVIWLGVPGSFALSFV